MTVKPPRRVWHGGLAKRWSGAAGLARWAGARGGGAAGDAGMGRVLVRLLVALGLVAGWGESDRERECERERERETENVKVKERKRQNGVIVKSET
jgi:hypothetical protein